MAVQKTIVIEFPKNTDGTMTHKVRNFGEDLWRAIEQENLGSVGGIEAVDFATNSLVVQVFHSRKLATVRKLVSALLKKHFLDFCSQVTFKEVPD